MNATQHKNFAVNVLGVSEKFYNKLNADNTAKNAAIRKARAEWYDALINDPAQADEKAKVLNKSLGLA